MRRVRVTKPISFFEFFLVFLITPSDEQTSNRSNQLQANVDTWIRAASITGTIRILTSEWFQSTSSNKHPHISITSFLKSPKEMPVTHLFPESNPVRSITIRTPTWIRVVLLKLTLPKRIIAMAAMEYHLDADLSEVAQVQQKSLNLFQNQIWIIRLIAASKKGIWETQVRLKLAKIQSTYKNISM